MPLFKLLNHLSRSSIKKKCFDVSVYCVSVTSDLYVFVFEATVSPNMHTIMGFSIKNSAIYRIQCLVQALFYLLNCVRYCTCLNWNNGNDSSRLFYLLSYCWNILLELSIKVENIEFSNDLLIWVQWFIDGSCASNEVVSKFINKFVRWSVFKCDY